MGVRLDNTGLAAGLALALACASAWPQAPAVVPVPPPQANKATGQTAQPAAGSPTQLHGDAVSLGTVTYPPAGSLEPPVTPAPGVIADQVVGVVNGDLILESDVNEERRFEAFEPFTTPGSFSRERAISRLIDRTLILQQAKLQPDDTVPMEQVRTRALRCHSWSSAGSSACRF
jgi:hypothetical protein